MSAVIFLINGPGKKDFSIESCRPRESVASVGKKIVGRASAWEDWGGTFVILRSIVLPAYRRRGIASAMYRQIEEQSVRQLSPATSLSDDAFEFWKSFRPQAVANDLRHRPELIGRKVQKNGREGTIIDASGCGATIEFDDANAEIGTRSWIAASKLDDHLLPEVNCGSQPRLERQESVAIRLAGKARDAASDENNTIPGPPRKLKATW